jgi:hypothetical protein
MLAQLFDLSMDALVAAQNHAHVELNVRQFACKGNSAAARCGAGWKLKRRTHGPSGIFLSAALTGLFLIHRDRRSRFLLHVGHKDAVCGPHKRASSQWNFPLCRSLLESAST